MLCNIKQLFIFFGTLGCTSLVIYCSVLAGSPLDKLFGSYRFQSSAADLEFSGKQGSDPQTRPWYT